MLSRVEKLGTLGFFSGERDTTVEPSFLFGRDKREERLVWEVRLWNLEL